MKLKSLPLQVRQFLQFLVVGGTNALLDIGFLNVLLIVWPTKDDLLLVIFNSLAYLLAIVNSYIWNSRLTFRHYAQNSKREKAYFFLQAGVSLILSNVTFMVTLHVMSVYQLPFWLVQNMSKALAMAIPSLASFMFMKYFVFRKQRSL